ncbi:MAG: aldo/keto reductase [Candidatus Odinarchaeia archaeon]
MKKLSIDSTVTLNNGVKMPLLGFGTFEIPNGKPIIDAVLTALNAGYRLIDTAQLYRNEEGVGKAIRDSGIPRSGIFVTTKLEGSNQGYSRAINSFNESLKTMGLEYIDLFLIHWPTDRRLESWNALEEILESGKCKAIGVSNYSISDLIETMENSTIVPMVNQVEFNPYNYQEKLLKFCQKNNIQLEAYSPLTKGTKLNDPKLVKIASKYSKTPAQILIRWCLQKKVVVIPKSSRPEKIYENSHVFDFEITNEDMKLLDSFTKF